MIEKMRKLISSGDPLEIVASMSSQSGRVGGKRLIDAFPRTTINEIASKSKMIRISIINILDFSLAYWITSNNKYNLWMSQHGISKLNKLLDQFIVSF